MTPKEKKELVILAIGIIILVVLIIYVNRPKETEVPRDDENFPLPGEIRPVVASGMVAPSVDTSTRSEYGEAAGIRYAGWENRDPLDNSIVLEKIVQKPVETAVKKEETIFPVEKYEVSAVIWGSKKPQAIVNNKIINIGDMLDSGEIVRIDKNGVHVHFEGREVLLTIK